MAQTLGTHPLCINDFEFFNTLRVCTASRAVFPCLLSFTKYISCWYIPSAQKSLSTKEIFTHVVLSSGADVLVDVDKLFLSNFASRPLTKGKYLNDRAISLRKLSSLIRSS